MNKKTYLGILTIITIVCIFTGLLYHVGHAVGGFLSGRNYFLWDKWDEDDNNDENAVPGGTVQSKLDAFTAIKIDAEVLGVTIETGDSYSISGDASKGLMPKYEVQNGTLVISQKSVSFNSFFGENYQYCNLTVTVPKNITLKNIQTDTATGETNISGIQAINSNIKSSTGEVSIRDSKLGNAVVRSDTGEIEIRGCSFTSGDISSSVGDVNVESDTDLSKWKLDLETSVGDVLVNNRDCGESFSQSGTEGTMKLSSSVGDVSLKY